MRIQFFWLNLNCPVRMNLGVALLSARLRQAGHRTKITHLNEEVGLPFDQDRILAEAREFHPDLLAVSFGSNHFKYVPELCAFLKAEFPGRPIICGGIHTTLRPEEVIEIPQVDVVCVGEADDVFVGFVAGLERGEMATRTPGFWVRQGEVVYRNPPAAMPDITDQPTLDLDGIDYPAVLAANRGVFEVMSGRGCPYQCSFCFNPALFKVYRDAEGRRVTVRSYCRKRSVDSLLTEIKAILERYGDHVRALSFADDAFNYDREWFIRFAERYSKEVAVPYAANILVERLDDQTAELLFASRCSFAKIGVECASERIRRRVLHKPFSNAKIYRGVELLRKHHVNTRGYLIAGIPGETEGDVTASFRFAAELELDTVRLCVLYPLPGTAVHKYCAERDLLQGMEHENFDEISTLRWSPPMRLFLGKAIALYPWFLNSFLRNGASEAYAGPLRQALQMSSAEWNDTRATGWIADVSKRLSERLRVANVPHYAAPFPERPDVTFLLCKDRKIKIANVDT